MGSKSYVFRLDAQLFILLICSFFPSCNNSEPQKVLQVLKPYENVPSNYDLSYNPFSCSDEIVQANMFTEILLDEKNTYQLPGKLGSEQLQELFLQIKKGYTLEQGTVSPLIKRQYHDFPHALDVFVTTHILLQGGGAVFLKDTEKTALLIAALGHDALHTGVFNSFLIRSKHKYAFEDGNESIQEKRSLKFLLQILDSLEIFLPDEATKNDDRKTTFDYRKLISESILWTDMARHKEQLKAVNEILPLVLDKLREARVNSNKSESSSGASFVDIQNDIDLSGELSTEVRHLLAGFILHCADVSNLGKPWDISEKWASLVCSEFFTQGDLEKKLNMKVSMNCDRTSTSIPQSQLNFGKYVIEELYSLLSKIVNDGGNELLMNFNSNQKKWAEILSREKTQGIPYEFRGKSM